MAKIKTVLVSQPKPKLVNSPYFELQKKRKLKIDFVPFIHVKEATLKEIRLQKLDLSKFMIENAEFDTFIKAYKCSDDVIIFLDPPYYLEKGNKLYGKNGNMHENFDHVKLFECISNKNCFNLCFDIYK